MKLVIFGSTGRTGLELTRQALALGHTVTAVVRGPIRLPMSHEQLRVVKATFTDEDAITKALGGQEAVLSGVGGTTQPSTHLCA